MSRGPVFLTCALLLGCSLPPTQPAEPHPVEGASSRTPTEGGAPDPESPRKPKAELPSHCRDCEREAGRCVEWVMDGIEDRTVAYQMDCDDACCPNEK